jgi:hypothetical protein
MRNDTFAQLMEYMDSLSAPPYLRFWTNADIYRQFATLSLSETTNETTTTDLMRSDALCVFDAHFSQNAELPICLFHEKMFGRDEAITEHCRVVDDMRSRIETNPDPNLFRYAQKLVLDIIDDFYIDGFRQYWTRMHKNPTIAFDKSIGGSTKTMANHTGLGDADEGGIAHLDYMDVDLGDQMLGWHMDDVPKPPTKSTEFIQAQQKTQTSSSPALGGDLGDEFMIPSDKDTELNAASLVSPRKDTDHDVADLLDGEEGDGTKRTAHDDAMVHIASAITTLREQLMLLDSNIEKTRAKLSSGPIPNIQRNMEINTRLKKLQKTKKNLEEEVDKLLKLAEEMEPSSNSGTCTDDAGVAEVRFLDLRDVSVAIRVVETQDEKSASAMRRRLPSALNGIPGVGAISQHIISPSINMLTGSMPSGSSVPFIQRLRQATFIVEVERHAASDAAERGWLITRSYDDFCQLHQQLSEQFVKVTKIPFPVPRKSTLFNSSSLTAAERLTRITSELETYVQMTLGDQLLCESRPMQHFFRSEVEQLTQKSTKKKINPLDIRKRVLTILRDVYMPSKSRPSSAASNNPNTASPRISLDSTDIPTISVDTTEDKPLPSPESRPSIEEQIKSNPRTDTPSSISRITNLDVSLIIDTFFALLIDLFDLHSQHWIRRKVLGVLRKILLTQTQKTWLSTAVEQLMRAIGSGLASNVSVTMIDMLLDRLWPPPDRAWVYANGHLVTQTEDEKQERRHRATQLVMDLVTENPAELMKPDPSSSSMLQDDTDAVPGNGGGNGLTILSNASFSSVLSTGDQPALSAGASSTVQFYLYRMVGARAAIRGIRRVMDMLQYEQFNRILVINLLETVVKQVLAEDRRKY